MNALEHKIPPPVILVFTGTAMWVLAHYTFTWHLPFTLKLIGILSFLAIALFFGPPAIMNFRKYKTTIDPVRTCVEPGNGWPFQFLAQPDVFLDVGAIVCLVGLSGGALGRIGADFFRGLYSSVSDLA
jgi:hypothetical protein